MMETLGAPCPSPIGLLDCGACAWCCAPLLDLIAESHGICPPCEARFFPIPIDEAA